jgi:cytochrome c-type biogenesis protein CcmE
MKKTHIILLILVISGIVGMSFFIKDLTTQETFSSAQKKGKFVVVKVKLDKSKPIAYDPVKNPNLTVFYAIDKDGKSSKVMYTNSKPTDIERSEGIDLNGYMRADHFECSKIQMKCPSKYKDDMKQAEKNLPTASADSK